MRSFLLVASMAALVVAPGAHAQEWNTPEALALVRLAVARRAAAVEDIGFRDYTAQAQGVVLFLAQLGEGLSDPPLLVQADQLALEVYWKAPGSSKQRIVGRRDRIELPSGISYHRDHLGIVQNNYPDRIRIGNCDEICNVVHPLARSRVLVYDFAIVDSLRIDFPSRTVDVFEVLVRPKDVNAPRAVGSLFIEAETGQVVRLRISFTRSAYRDEALEDITILLDNALWDGSHWLPRFQEIEVRRRTSWLNFPARGIIRTTVRIDDYDFDTDLPDNLFLGPEVVQAPDSVLADFVWTESLDDALADLAGTGEAIDLASVRDEMERVVSRRILSGLAPVRLGADSVSALVHFNRVEGLALGAGIDVDPPGGLAQFSGWLGYGFSDERVKARLRLRHVFDRGTLGVVFQREVRDVMDEPVISGVLNSLLSQELGNDFGDYYLVNRAALQGSMRVGRGVVSALAGYEDVTSVSTAASPAAGSFDTNPALGDGSFWFARLTGGLATQRVPGTTVWEASASVEVGTSTDLDYVRVAGAAQTELPAGSTAFRASAWGGWGTDAMPRYRSFAIGGRGNLVGERFRAWGGNSAAYGLLEWRVPVPFPALALGSLGSTGAEILLAPTFGIGWAGRQPAGSPWQSSDGARPVLGIGVEWLHRVFHVDVGYSIRDGRVRAAFDVRRSFWSVL